MKIVYRRLRYNEDEDNFNSIPVCSEKFVVFVMYVCMYVCMYVYLRATNNR